jgi:hypothetical protein
MACEDSKHMLASDREGVRGAALVGVQQFRGGARGTGCRKARGEKNTN